jgi:DNA-binding CsgD family transcriptional regulator
VASLENRSRRTASEPPRPRGEELLERARELDALAAAFASVTRTGRGSVILVSGEAGIGKTALVQRFRAGLDRSGLERTRVLAGACEALQTPRPLGALVDIAAETRGELAALVDAGAGPSAVLGALLDELRVRRTTIVVLEDLHWADEATLDLLRLLARRVTTVPALVVATCRDTELERDHPLRVTLGELPATAVSRLVLEPLSLAAVTELARPYGVDPDVLHGQTAGNPFYVTEALAAGGATLPDSVRDAVLARAARLRPGARALLDAVAVAPPRAELWLLEALGGDDLVHLEACLASGMLRVRNDTVAFRHEIARVAIEAALPPDRKLALHRLALAALAGAADKRVDLARLAHHAEAAGSGEAVLRYARAAGERAAALGAHREAAAQFARALRFADVLPSAERAELLEQRSYECYLTSAISDAIDARRQALAEHHRRGDRLREGDSRRWLSRLAWFLADNDTAEREGRNAVELLEGLPPSAELAMAYSHMADLRMLASEVARARDWGRRAIELAERLDETETLVHALHNVGLAELYAGVAGGAKKLARSLELATEAGLDEHVTRAHANVAAQAIRTREYALGDRHLAVGIEYSRDRDLDTWLLSMTGWQARSQLDQGRWDDAEASAAEVLRHPHVVAPSRITPLIVIGLLRVRRGDGDPWEPLDEALDLAEATGELRRLAPVAAARAEARWLAGEHDLAAVETDRALPLALERGDAWAAGELAVWRSRAGAGTTAPWDAVAEPFRLELAGNADAAFKRWRLLGCPYEAAIVQGASTSERALRSSLIELQELGARPAAARVARTLRERGVMDVSRGPRASTRRNPAGLTAREQEVLVLLAKGLRNAHIAEQLVVSAKTIDHHVSAILRKLQAATRTEAAAQAARLGLLER